MMKLFKLGKFFFKAPGWLKGPLIVVLLVFLILGVVLAPVLLLLLLVLLPVFGLLWLLSAPIRGITDRIK